MPGKPTLKFTLRDYVSLSVALSLALAVWLLHNLSHKYSQVVQCNVVAVSDIDGRAKTADAPVILAARCDMDGFSILYYKLFPEHEVEVKFNKNEFIHLGGTRYCIPTSNLLSHSHEIFGDAAKCEYFVTDTLFFDFQAVDYKKVPVLLVRKIDYDPQYMATGPIAISPDSVFVYGPQEQLEQIQSIATRPLFLSGLCSDSAGELQLDIPSGMRASSAVVEYHLSVSRYVEEVVSVPVEVVGVPSGKEITVSPSIAQVTLRCTFPKSNVSNDEIKVTVDYKDFSGSISGRCLGQIQNLPKGTLSSHISPEIFDCVENTEQ